MTRGASLGGCHEYGFQHQAGGGTGSIASCSARQRGGEQCVTTDLPASQSVTAPDASTLARNDPQALSYDVSHQAYYDRSASAMVYQEVDEKTDQVVDQYPDDAVLRRRAYFNALEMSKDDPHRVIPTNLVA